jgi:hypothetical protein
VEKKEGKIKLPAISIRTLVSSLKFLKEATAFKQMGRMPTATAPIANQRKG